MVDSLQPLQPQKLAVLENGDGVELDHRPVNIAKLRQLRLNVILHHHKSLGRVPDSEEDATSHVTREREILVSLTQH